MVEVKAAVLGVACLCVSLGVIGMVSKAVQGVGSPLKRTIAVAAVAVFMLAISVSIVAVYLINDALQGLM